MMASKTLQPLRSPVTLHRNNTETGFQNVGTPKTEKKEEKRKHRKNKGSENHTGRNCIEKNLRGDAARTLSQRLVLIPHDKRSCATSTEHAIQSMACKLLYGKTKDRSILTVAAQQRRDTIRLTYSSTALALW